MDGDYTMPHGRSLVARHDPMQSIIIGHLQASTSAANDSSSRKGPPLGLLGRADDL